MNGILLLALFGYVVLLERVTWKPYKGTGFLYNQMAICKIIWSRFLSVHLVREIDRAIENEKKTHFRKKRFLDVSTFELTLYVHQRSFTSPPLRTSNLLPYYFVCL